MITLLEENKHNMKDYPGDYKGHSYKVLTSESIYDLIYELDDSEEQYDKLVKVTEEYPNIFKQYLPEYDFDIAYPCIYDFKSNSKEVFNEIVNFMKAKNFEDYDDSYDLWDIFEDITYDYDKGLAVTALEELPDILVDKMGGDLVLWDTGYIGFVGYDNYGPCGGAEILPIDYKEFEE